MKATAISLYCKLPLWVWLSIVAVVAVAVPMVPTKFITGAVTGLNDGPRQFSVGERVARGEYGDKIPTGTLGTVTGEIGNGDCESGHYKVEFDSWPRSKKPGESYWCIKHYQIVPVP